MQLELQMAAAVAAWSTASVGRTRRRCVSAGCAEEGAGGRAKGGGVKEGEHVPRAVGVEVWEEGGHMRPRGLNQSLYSSTLTRQCRYSPPSSKPRQTMRFNRKAAGYSLSPNRHHMDSVEHWCGTINGVPTHT